MKKAELNIFNAARIDRETEDTATEKKWLEDYRARCAAKTANTKAAQIADRDATAVREAPVQVASKKPRPRAKTRRAVS